MVMAGEQIKVASEASSTSRRDIVARWDRPARAPQEREEEPIFVVWATHEPAATELEEMDVDSEQEHLKQQRDAIMEPVRTEGAHLKIDESRMMYEVDYPVRVGDTVMRVVLRTDGALELYEVAEDGES